MVPSKNVSQNSFLVESGPTVVHDGGHAHYLWIGILTDVTGVHPIFDRFIFTIS
jgi:hypothetical protein